MADQEKKREKTTEDQPILLQASDPVNSTVFDSPAVKHKLPLYLQNILLACGYDTMDAIVKLNIYEPGSNDINRMCRFNLKCKDNDWFCAKCL